jgi:hypothetical protein
MVIEMPMLIVLGLFAVVVLFIFTVRLIVGIEKRFTKSKSSEPDVRSSEPNVRSFLQNKNTSPIQKKPSISIDDQPRNKVVYCHRKKTDMQPFYIGLGSINRANDFVSRNYKWKRVYELHGCHVEILHRNLTPAEAAEIEIALIAEYRRRYPGQMTNLTDGGETGTRNYGRRTRRWN